MTTITLTHPFKDRCIDVDELFSASNGPCQELNRFCYNIEKQAKKQTLQDPDKYKGDALEIFVEFLCKYYDSDNRIGFTDYQPVATGDTGVDGIGKSPINGKPATAQVKFRQHDYFLTANGDHLSNFVVASLMRYQVPQNPVNMVVITTGAGIHYFTDTEMFRGNVRVLNRYDLMALVDNIELFWMKFKESFLTSRLRRKTPGKIELRQHQKEASEAIAQTEADRGLIELPTGTGKTFVQADAISQLDGHKVVVVLSPRVLLSFQHLKSVAKYLQSKKINAEYLNLNSGRFDESEIVQGEVEAGFEAYEVKSTTSSYVLKKEYERVKELGRLFVISSTYHSVERILEAGITIDVAFHDEAHWLVTENFGKIHDIGEKNFYFTATPRHSMTDQGWGMNNEERFGEMLLLKTPKEMVEAGEMVPPALHIVTEEDHRVIQDNDYGAMARCIFNSYCRHAEIIKGKSSDPSQIGAKLLVTVDGQRSLRGILESDDLIKFRTDNPDINIMAISSDVGVYDNGHLMDTNNNSKDQFFDCLRTLENDERAIIIYVDMLTEGIDVPGITGFMPMRTMSDDQLKQGIGRACRLHSLDRQRFYGGDIHPEDQDDYIKRFAWVVVPDITTISSDYVGRYSNVVRLMYSDFGFDYTRVFIDSIHGLNENEGPAYLNDLSDRRRQIRSDITKFCHSIEDEFDRQDLFVDDLNFIKLIANHGVDRAEQAYSMFKLKDPFKVYVERTKRMISVGKLQSAHNF